MCEMSDGASKEEKEESGKPDDITEFSASVDALESEVKPPPLTLLLRINMAKARGAALRRALPPPPPTPPLTLLQKFNMAKAKGAAFRQTLPPPPPPPIVLSVKRGRDLEPHEFDEERHVRARAEETDAPRYTANPVFWDDIDKAIEAREAAIREASGLSEQDARKTVATDGELYVVSGWSRIPELTEKVLVKSTEIGHDLAAMPGIDGDTPGKYYACHAEKKLSIISEGPFGISRPMCADCSNYFSKLAVHKKKPIVTADPENVWIFYGDGSSVRYGPVGRSIPNVFRRR